MPITNLDGDDVDERTLQRFLSWIEVQPNGCWHWTGKTNKNGYGYFWLEGKSRLAHRVSYEHFVGPIPDEFEVDHECHGRDKTCVAGQDCLHRRCVRPTDLEAVPGPVNIMRSRGVAPANAAKTECASGHELTQENTYLYPDGRERGCRACRAVWVKEWRDARRTTVAVPMAERTHCPQQHEYTEANTYIAPGNGGRACRTCRRDKDREAKRALRAKQKAAAATA